MDVNEARKSETETRDRPPRLKENCDAKAEARYYEAEIA